MWAFDIIKEYCQYRRKRERTIKKEREVYSRRIASYVSQVLENENSPFLPLGYKR